MKMNAKKQGRSNKIILITGSGSIANKHIKILLQLNYTVLALINSDIQRKRFDKESYNKIIFIKNLKDININDIFFVIIASSTYKHRKDIEFFIKKKVNIFCEKPIFNKLKSVKKIREKIINSKIFFFVNYQFRQHFLLNKMKSLINKEKNYHIEAKSGYNLKFWRKNKIRNKSYYIDIKKGGGVIFELIHEINLIKYIFGSISKIKTIKSNYNLKKAEDHAISIFKTNKNIPGILIQDMLAEKKEKYIKIFTSKNTIKLDFIKNKIFIFNKKNSKTIKNKYKGDQISLIKKNIQNYIELIKKGKFNIKFFDEAIEDIKICIKMHEKFYSF